MQALGTFLTALGVFVIAVTLWRLVRVPAFWAAIRNPQGVRVVPAEPPVVGPAEESANPEDENVAVPSEDATTTTVAPSSMVTALSIATPPPPVVTPAPVVTGLRPSSSSATTSAQAAAITTTPEQTVTIATRSTTRATTAGPKTAASRPKAATTRPKTTATRSRKAATGGVPAASCTASVDNRTPATGESVVVMVTSNVPTTPFTVTAHYKSKDRALSGVTNGAGVGSVTFDVGSATKGYKVKVDVNISGKAACSTEFTPR